MSETYNYYYLLYKIKQNSILWIVEESESFNELYKKIRDFNSKYENYFIVKKIYSEEEIEYIINLNLKQFSIFKIDKQCKLMFRTK